VPIFFVVPVTVGVVVLTSLYGSTPLIFVVPTASVVPSCLLFRMTRFGGAAAGSQGEHTAPVLRQ